MHTYNLDGFCYSEFRRPFSETELGKFVALLPPLQGAWIAGGAVRRMVMDEPTGDDIDVFFKHESAYYQFQCELGRNAQFMEETKRRRVYQIRGEHRTVKIDLVHARYFPSPDDILWDFDLTCCQFAIDNDQMYVGSLSMLHAAMRICKPANTAKLRMWPQHLVRYLRQGFKGSPEAIDILVKEMEADPKCLTRPPEYSG